jgi:hypothetical protein
MIIQICVNAKESNLEEVFYAKKDKNVVSIF